MITSGNYEGEGNKPAQVQSLMPQDAAEKEQMSVPDTIEGSLEDTRPYTHWSKDRGKASAVECAYSCPGSSAGQQSHGADGEAGGTH